MARQNTVEFRLKNTLGRDLGMGLTLSRKLIRGDGQAFFNLLKSKKELTVSLGSAWRW